MAKKKGDTPNLEPSEMTFYLASPNVTQLGATESYYIDLSQVASLVNRRFYRQGLNWAVSGIKIMTAGGSGSVTVSRLPNTWVMANSWVKGFENWRERIKDAFGSGTLEESETKGRFLDFKIYADANHHQQGLLRNLLPRDRGGNQPTEGEYKMAKITLENAAGGSVQHEIIAVGANYPGVSGVTAFDAVSLIEGYSNSRRLPNIRDPNTPADLDDTAGTLAENWMRGMHSGTGNGDENVIRDVAGYDLPPYPFENDGTNFDTMYPGGANQLQELAVHDYVQYSSTTIGAQSFAKGGTFPCGLIRIDHYVRPDSTKVSNVVIQVDMVPGEHRGYLAEPMGDM